MVGKRDLTITRHAGHPTQLPEITQICVISGVRCKSRYFPVRDKAAGRAGKPRASPPRTREHQFPNIEVPRSKARLAVRQVIVPHALEGAVETEPGDELEVVLEPVPPA